jgi:hypothetical protein
LEDDSDVPSAGRRIGRRERWAAAENERRQQTYRVAVAEWQRYDTELRAMHATVVSFGPDPGTAVPVPLDRGELAYLVVDGAQAVEAPATGQLPTPLATPFPVPAGGGTRPAGLRPGEHGTVVVTDRRLIFAGVRAYREWPYARLTGMRHDPAVPVTLLRLDHGRGASGVLLDPYRADGFRLLLQLAVADANYGRRHLQAHLGQLISAHARQQPTPPPPAGPEQAPARTVLPSRRVTLAAAVTAIGLLALVTTVAPRLVVGPAAPAAAQFVTVTPATPPADRDPGPTAGAARSRPVPKETRSRVPPPAVPPSTPTPAATPTTTVSASPAPAGESATADLCGAPANPYGYTFCGGSVVTDPDPGVCTYFDCIKAFWKGKGFMMVCDDGKVTMSGGRAKSCSRHDGDRQPVYQ